MEDSPDTRGNTHVLWTGDDMSLEIVDNGLGRDLRLTRKGDPLFSVTMRSVRRLEVGLPEKGGDGGPGTDPHYLREIAELISNGGTISSPVDPERLHDIADRLDYLNPSPPGLEDKAFKWLADHVKEVLQSDDIGPDPIVLALYSLVVATKRSGTMSAIGGGLGGALQGLLSSFGAKKED